MEPELCNTFFLLSSLLTVIASHYNSWCAFSILYNKLLISKFKHTIFRHFKEGFLIKYVLFKYDCFGLVWGLASMTLDRTII